jgi:ribosome-binding factor A
MISERRPAISGTPSTRMRRINVALRQVLGEAIGRELVDPRLGFITITTVDAAPDLRTATVYYTVLEPARREASQEALESASGVLQGAVGRELRTRHTPKLRFTYDEHQERAVALTRLIETVAPAPDAEGADAE